MSYRLSGANGDISKEMSRLPPASRHDKGLSSPIFPLLILAEVPFQGLGSFFLPLILAGVPFQGLASVFLSLILVGVSFQGLASVFLPLILAGVPFQGLVSLFLPLILGGVPFQGLASSFPLLILADACFQGLEVSICFRQISMQQSLQKNHAFFLQGLLFLYKNAVFEPKIGILAEKRGISSAGISTSVNRKAPSTDCRAHPLTEGHHHLSAKEFSFADTCSVYAQISQREPIRFRSRWLI